MKTPYVYKIKSMNTGKYYIGCQYGKEASPENFWKTYFTSSKYVKENIDEFEIVYVKARKDARYYEQKLLSRIYSLYGITRFCEIMINRNLAPGIIHDENEKKRISKRLKERWNSGKMKYAHEKAKETKKTRIYKKYNHSQEVCESISKRMKNNNPMFRDDVKIKHKKAINTPENIKQKSERAIGNTYTKGKKWYNNGEISKMMDFCPEGWFVGRLNPHWNYKRKKINE